MANRPGAGVAPDLERERCVMYFRISASPLRMVRAKPISSCAASNRSSSMGGSIGACGAGHWLGDLGVASTRRAQKEASRSRARMKK